MSCRAVRQEMMLCVNVPGGDISGYAATTDWQVFPFAEPVMADRVRAVSTVCTAEGNNYYFQLAEVQIYGTAEQEEVPESSILPVLDFSSSKTAAESLSAANLVDGDLSNFWSTAPSTVAMPASPGYFDLTFAAPSVITQVHMMPRVVDGTPTCFPSAFKFQYALGDSAWTDVPNGAFSGHTTDTQWQNITLPTPVKADKLRVIGTTLDADPHGNYYFQLAEVQVLGYADGEVPPAKAYGETYYVSDAVSTTGLTEQTLHEEAVYVGCEDNGSKIVFTNVDFGEDQTLSIEMGVAGWHGELRNFTWEDAVLDVYLDNLASAPVAKVYVDYDEESYEQTVAIEPHAADFAREISGIHNLIISFRGDKTAFCWMRLSTEDAAPNVIELREQAYLENQPDLNQLIDLMSDTWGGTDMLGRKIETNETGESTYEEDKIVGMFVWDWFIRDQPVRNVEEILKTPNGLNGYPAGGANYAWGESVYGFYQSYDEWVIRQQGELLADAGVDVIFFDTTNLDWTFKSGYLKFFKVYNDMLNDGAKMPKISFILPFSPNGYTTRDLVSLYENIYEKGLYEECWFYWNGKPLILNGAASSNPAYINDFFSFKRVTSTYVNKVTNPTDSWAWLELYPQNQYVDSQGRTFMTVGVAQNHNGKRLCAMNAGDDVLGRTMTRNADGTFTRHTEEGALLKGYNFQQQFDRAIETDTDFIFITGWNEWIAGRYENWEGTYMAHPDQYNPEYSRDLEPSKGVLKDAYYCQLVENVRRFKGARPVPTVERFQTVSVDGTFADWADANTYYTYVNNIQDRACNGYVDYYYTNTSGRNDLALAKATMDSEYAYFYVQTMDDMVGMNEESFMQLFLNVDRDAATGWEGYDFMLNRTAPTAETMTLDRCTGGFIWEKAGEATITVTFAEMCAYLGEKETYVSADLTAATVTTTVQHNVFDVNKDGTVDARDITRAQRYYGSDFPDADIDKDGKVTINDLILILNHFTDLFV